MAAKISGPKTGIIVLSIMAVLWCFITSFTMPSLLRLPIVVTAVLISASMVLIAVRRQIGAASKFDKKIFWMSVVFEAVAAYAAIRFLVAIHAQTFILGAVAIVVGLHFIGMWLATGRRGHLGVCAAMCTLGVAAFLLPPPWRMQVAGLGSAIILWLAAWRQIAALPR